MAKLVILLVCIAVFNAVSALECYSCDGETCKKDMKQWEKAKCGSSADPSHEAACQKIVYKDKDNNEAVARRCIIAPKTGEAPCNPIAGGSDTKCLICKTELCNSASSINFSFATVVSVLMVFLGQKYLL